MQTTAVVDLNASGLVPADLNARGVAPPELAATNSSSSGTEGYVIPYFNIDGDPIPFYRVRLFDQEPKYRQPRGTPNHLYFPINFRQTLERVESKTKLNGHSGGAYVLLTEGEKKSACACKVGFPTVGIGGVDSWRTKTVILPEATSLSTLYGKKKLIKAKLPGGDPEDFRELSTLAVGMEDLVNLIVTRGLHVIITFDSDQEGGLKPQVQRAAAQLGYELRHRGIPISRIRSMLLPFEGVKTGLDDFLIKYGAEALQELITETLARRCAFPTHPNVKSYVNSKLQGKLTRKEAQEVSLAVLTELDTRGRRLTSSATSTPFYFDEDTCRLMPAPIMHKHGDPLHEVPFGKFLYKEFGLSSSDTKVMSWLASQFTGEPPLEEADPKKVLSIPRSIPNSLAYQISDSQFALITSDPENPITIYSNGSKGILFEEDQVEPLDDAKLLEQFYQQRERSLSPWWLEVFKEVNLEERDMTKDETRLYATLLFYVSPWMNRWRGAQLPIELVIGEAGSGKAQPLDAKVLTPVGFKKMGDIVAGDEIITPKGTTSKVLVVHPQGLKEIYKVTFHDGSSTECCGDHLWHVQTPNQRWAKRPGVVKSLSKIREQDLRYVNRNRFRNYIPLIAQAIDFTCTNSFRPLDPYVLGALLGDGGFTSKKSWTVTFTSDDTHNIEKVSHRLPEDDRLVPSSKNAKRYNYRVLGTNTSTALRSLNLYGHKSIDKFIPEQYLWNKASERLELLQGLMDTDGSAITAGAAVFNSSSVKLAEGVRWLVQSLGGTASISKRTAPQKQGHHLAYNVHIRMPMGVCPFTLPRKIDYFNCVRHQKPLRGIRSIEYIGEKEAKCITITDPEGLYITDDFIVTHNSSLYEMRLAILTGKPFLRNAPQDLRDWHASVANTGGLHVTDNVQFTNKELKQRISDEICRIVTEPEPHIEMRKLYSTSTLFSTPVQTAFAVTAIQLPFNNTDLIQRSAILELGAVTSGHDGDWVRHQIGRFGDRTTWVAHHLLVIHKFLNLAKDKWSDSYPASHRLAHYEQCLRLMAEVFGVESAWLPKALSVATSANMSEADWALEGLKIFAMEALERSPQGMTMFAADITDWAMGHEDFEDNQQLASTRRLGRYMQSHKRTIERVAGIYEDGMYANRIRYRVVPREKP